MLHLWPDQSTRRSPQPSRRDDDNSASRRATSPTPPGSPDKGSHHYDAANAATTKNGSPTPSAPHSNGHPTPSTGYSPGFIRSNSTRPAPEREHHALTGNIGSRCSNETSAHSSRSYQRSSVSKTSQLLPRLLCLIHLSKQSRDDRRVSSIHVARLLHTLLVQRPATMPHRHRGGQLPVRQEVSGLWALRGGHRGIIAEGCDSVLSPACHRRRPG
jgi:hypothetical protein